MIAANGKLLRTLLVLGRVSNVPTVWSNCLAAWLLGGGGPEWRLAIAAAGATLLYIGGMFLNDAFDAGFDAQHRRERPIPSGAIGLRTVWRLGFSFLALGVLLFATLGLVPLLLALALGGCIVLYDAVHKLVTFSPVLMASCRFFLYLAAASAAQMGVTGLTVWSAFVLGAYIVGLSCLARHESTGVVIRIWPLFLLAAPAVLALLVNDGPYLSNGVALSVILILWCIRSLRPALSEQQNIGRTVSGLLAGIVFVDLLAVADQPRETGAIFIALFLLALLFQRFIPAT
jgi:4-hydroxybenzoate polyprenyltransferase